MDRTRVRLLYLPPYLSLPADTASSPRLAYIERTRSDLDTTRRVYLTFDDGPYYTTPQLAEVLLQKKIRANFFIVGSQRMLSPIYDSTYQQLVSSDSFRVYNHSYSHAITHGRFKKYYQSPERVWADLDTNKAFLPAGASISRLPGKNAWKTSSGRQLSDKETRRLFRFMDSLKIGEQVIGWDVEWQKSTGSSEAELQKLIEQVEKKLSSASPVNRDVVVLLHDYLFKQKDQLQLLEMFIDHFQSRGDIKFDWVHNLRGVASPSN